MEFIAFGKPVEKLVGVTIAKLVAVKTIHKITWLGLVKALIKQHKRRSKSKSLILNCLIAIKFKTQHCLPSCDIIPSQATLLPLQIIFDDSQEQLPSSSIDNQVARELFPDSTLLKLATTGHEEPQTKKNTKPGIRYKAF